MPRWTAAEEPLTRTEGGMRRSRWVLAGLVLGILWAIRAGDPPLEDAARLLVISGAFSALSLIGHEIRVRRGRVTPIATRRAIVRLALAHAAIALTAAGLAAVLEVWLTNDIAGYIVAALLFVAIALLGAVLNRWIFGATPPAGDGGATADPPPSEAPDVDSGAAGTHLSLCEGDKRSGGSAGGTGKRRAGRPL